MPTGRKFALNRPRSTRRCSDVRARGDRVPFRRTGISCGVPVRWRALVREWDPPYRFVDVQVRGPYARWEHRHRFLEEGNGTWVEDRVTYRLPLGSLGRVAHALLVRRQIAALWRYRTRRLDELVGPVRAPGG